MVFTIAGTGLGPVPVTVSGGVASTTVALPPLLHTGTYTIEAAYSDPNTPSLYDSSNGQGVLTVSAATPMLSVSDGGTYNGKAFAAMPTATGVDGKAVSGTFTLYYYTGASASGTPSQTAPTNAGTYTVVAVFISSDTNYTNGTPAQTTFTISPAPISYTIGNDTQAYGYPANLAADLPPSFNTGINGETLGIAYSSSGDTSTATARSYAITGVVSNGTGLASNYSVTLTNGTLTVLGTGVTAVGSELWVVGGSTTDDSIQIDAAGASKTGSTGVKVEAKLDHIPASTTYNQSFTTLFVFLGSGNNDVHLAKTLTINAAVYGGNGNNKVHLGDGNNIVTLGNGNDKVHLGDGANTVMVGNGNDHIHAGNGNNVIVEGNGNDDIDAGNGDNLIVAGLGHHDVHVGDGSNILIDGSVQLTQSGDSLRQVLDDWIANGSQAANVASIRSRLSVTYNTHHANTLHAGRGLDWFWSTDTQDNLNVKKTDLQN